LTARLEKRLFLKPKGEFIRTGKPGENTRRAAARTHGPLNLLRVAPTHAYWGIAYPVSTATPPSEHTPLWRRCCFEPFPDAGRHIFEAG
jgi:hypothetical protein